MKRSFPRDDSSFEAGAEKTSSPPDGLLSVTTLANIAGENGKTCVQKASDNVSSWSYLGFSELLFLADAAWANSSQILPNHNDGLKSQFHDDLQGTSYTACCSKETSQDTLPTPDNAIRSECRQIASMQINIEEKDPWGEEENVPAKKLDNNGTPPNKELCNLVTELAAVSTPFKENHHPDNGSSHDIDLSKTPQQKPRRRKHRPKALIEGKPKRTRKPAIPNPFQSKENPTFKRKYVQRKGLNKSSTPPTEVTGALTKEMMPESAKISCRRSLNFEIGARDESSEGRENATAHLAKEIDVALQETNVGLVHDLNTSMKQASNNYILISDDSESPRTSPLRRNPLRAKPKENQTAKRKYVRKKGLNKTSAPTTEVTRELSKEILPESAKSSCRKSLNLGLEARDGSSAGIENETVHLGKEIGVAVHETNVGLAYDLKISKKQASNNYMSLSEDKQAPSTSPSKSNPPVAKAKGNATGKRKYVRRKRLNKSTTPPTEMTAALTEPKMPDSTKMSWRSSAAGRGNLNEHISKDNKSKRQALSSCMSLPEDTQAPSAYPAKSNPPAAYKNEKATGKRKYVRRKGTNESSTPPSEMKAELTEPMMSESTKMAQRRSLNFDMGARDESWAGRQNLDVHNSKENSVVAEERHVGLACNQSTSMKQGFHSFMSLPEDTQAPTTSPSKSNPPGAKLNANSVDNRNKINDQTKFRIQFPNIQKKRRRERGKRIFGSEYNTARVSTISEATERVNDHTQAFKEFILSLRRVRKRLLTKKKQNKNETAVSTSAYSRTNEMQQHQNFALENYHLPLGKPLDIACEVRRQIRRSVNALSEQFSQLDINKEARDLCLIRTCSSLVNDSMGMAPSYPLSFGPVKTQHPRPKVDIDE